jgi:hypothetical protein
MCLRAMRWVGFLFGIVPLACGARTGLDQDPTAGADTLNRDAGEPARCRRLDAAKGKE